MITKFDHVELNVQDVEKAKNFFIDILGFKLHSIIPNEGVFVSSGAALVGLFDAKPLGITHIAFTAEDVEKSMEELKKKGVKFRRDKPTVNIGTGRMIIGLKDLDGNDWQLAKQVQKGTAEIK